MFTPLSDRVVIDPTPVSTTSKGGVLLAPAPTNAVSTEGVVISIGPGRTEHGILVPMTVKPGDRVIWGKFAGATITVEGREFLLMRESDIAGVIR
jgi:chaperonin GroES